MLQANVYRPGCTTVQTSRQNTGLHWISLNTPVLILQTEIVCMLVLFSEMKDFRKHISFKKYCSLLNFVNIIIIIIIIIIIQ